MTETAYCPAFIISGAQTGADQGGLDAARILGIPQAGFCPKGRKSDEGPIPNRYFLIETLSEDYPQRTKLNIEHSDATIILGYNLSSPGTRLTINHCKRLGKPYLAIDLRGVDDNTAGEMLVSFLSINLPGVLNVAGNRERKAPGLQVKTRDILVYAITKTMKGNTYDRLCVQEDPRGRSLAKGTSSGFWRERFSEYHPEGPSLPTSGVGSAQTRLF